MALDIEFYRRTLHTHNHAGHPLRRISVIDIHPEGATHTIVLVMDMVEMLYNGCINSAFSGNMYVSSRQSYVVMVSAMMTMRCLIQ